MRWQPHQTPGFAVKGTKSHSQDTVPSQGQPLLERQQSPCEQVPFAAASGFPIVLSWLSPSLLPLNFQCWSSCSDHVLNI